MQRQVLHLEKEAKLNELTRLMVDLRTQFHHQISASLIIDAGLFDILFSLCRAGEAKSTLIYNININKILYTETSWSLHKSEGLKMYLAGNFREKEYKQWRELESLVINFSNSVIRYHVLSSSPNLAHIYLDEARKMLEPLHDLFCTEAIREQLVSINEILNPSK
jgi:hypothetical protein